MDSLIGVPAIAERLELSPQRVHQFIDSGRLKAKRLGRDYFATESEVERFAAIQRKPGRPWHKSTARRVKP